MNELVSILIPAYNAERWIRECIESALAQTWIRKEIIVVDDGSRDATLEIARSYASPSVQVTTQGNGGASAARNLALSLAQGDYIQWLDADDVLVPDKVAKQMMRAEPGRSSRILMSGSWGRFYHRPAKSKFTPDALWEDLEPGEWLYRKLKGNLWMAIESWLVSRKLTEMAGPWNELMSLDDDGEYFCRVLSCSLGVRFIPEARSLCRRGTFGLSHSATITDSKRDSLLTSLCTYVHVLRSMEDSPRVKAACMDLLNRWAIEFHPERPDLLRRMESLASDLGGKLSPPELHAKYRWLQRIVGWRIAKKAQNALPVLRNLVYFYGER